MKKRLLLIMALASGVTFAQTRYNDEVFSQVNVTSDVTYATNIDFLTSDFSDPAQVQADLTAIKTAIATVSLFQPPTMIQRMLTQI